MTFPPTRAPHVFERNLTMTAPIPSMPAPSPSGSQTGGSAADATSPASLDAMPDPQLRAVAYVRESTEEQGQGFSPDAQRQGIASFAADNGMKLTGEYCDFHSGWRKSDARPHFQRLMTDAADRQFDVVLVFHTSRFARNQVESRRYKQLLREQLGIRVISVTQPMGEDPSDPAAFMAESIHEMFDEYYSVSLSFWTRSGLREKARQGHLVGSLPWGYMRDAATKLAVPDPARAPLVTEMFDRYLTGQESDSSIASWLNAKGARTARDRAFSKDTVREMLCNAAYAGWVTALRSKDRSIRGLHQPLVSDETFDRVQEIRGWRTRVTKPGRPSPDYLLRKILLCERCGQRMHGTRGSRAGVRRYQCSTRRRGGDCAQPMVQAEPLEAQLVAWLRRFSVDDTLRDLTLAEIASQVDARPTTDESHRAFLSGQLDRLRDLYVMGDLKKNEYVLRRQALEEELERMAPPFDPDLDRAADLLQDFARFWEAEPSSAERYKLLTTLFASVWQKDGTIIAVTPHKAFTRYFTTASKVSKPDQESGVTLAGATGLEPATSGVTGRRSNQLSYAPVRVGRMTDGGSARRAVVTASAPRRRRLATLPPGGCSGRWKNRSPVHGPLLRRKHHMLQRLAQITTVFGLVLMALAATAAIATAATITGTDHRDKLRGTSSADTIAGLGGNDLIRAGAGDDQLDGGAGSDRIIGASGNDTIRTGAGFFDFVAAGAGDDTITISKTGGGHGFLYAGPGNDTITGGNGSDRLHGGDGNDAADGGDGRDVLSGGKGDDVVHGGAGNDRIYANIGADTIYGDDGNDTLFALARIDVSNDGSATVDTVVGGAGNDKIHTRDGEADRIDCGDGKDQAFLDLEDVIVDATDANPNGSCERVVRMAPKLGEDSSENKTQSPSEDQATS